MIFVNVYIFPKKLTQRRRDAYDAEEVMFFNYFSPLRHMRLCASALNSKNRSARTV